jgi:hypothetical protein
MPTTWPIYAQFFGRARLPSYIGLSFNGSRASSTVRRNGAYRDALENAGGVMRHEFAALLHLSRHHKQLNTRYGETEMALIGYHSNTVLNQRHLKHPGPFLYDEATGRFHWREPWMEGVLAEWVARFPPVLKKDKFGKLRALASFRPKPNDTMSPVTIGAGGGHPPTEPQVICSPVCQIYPCNDRTRKSPSSLSRIASAAARAPAAVV